MKHIKKITAVALSALLVGSLSVPIFAEADASEKEEVIYIMTDAAGKVTDMEVVNIFAGGDITDYGDYSNVKMMNTTDEIIQNGNKITFSSDADKVYYQGTMESTLIPWDISIRYFLDGKEYSAEEITGQSGALEIYFSVSKNENCKGNFYDNYALQASFTLDTNICRNIVSDGATIANVGSDKQLTYTILPGKGIDAVIRADVADFEMESVAINGIRLNMNLEVDDAELMDKVDEIISAIGSIDDGATQVCDGTGHLYDATETLANNVGELNSGVGDLTSGAGDLYSGLTDITGNNDKLTGAAYTTYEGLCTAAAAELNAQLEVNGMDPVVLTPSNYSDVLLGLLEKLDAYIQQQMAYDEVTNQSSAAVTMISDVEKQISELKAQLDNYNDFYQGLIDYTAAVNNAAAGVESLKLNMDTLYSNTGTLELYVGELNDAAGELYSGTKDLSDGTSELADKTSDMDTQISDEIDSMISSITGSDAEVMSFVSDKNTNIDSVQFIIKTAAIKKAETVADDVQEDAPLTFWQKLIGLFGLD